MRSCRHFIKLCMHTVLAMVLAAPAGGQYGLNPPFGAGRDAFRVGSKAARKTALQIRIVTSFGFNGKILLQPTTGKREKLLKI